MRVTEGLPPHLQGLDEYSDPELLHQRSVFWARQRDECDARLRGELPITEEDQDSDPTLGARLDAERRQQQADRDMVRSTEIAAGVERAEKLFDGACCQNCIYLGIRKQQGGRGIETESICMRQPPRALSSFSGEGYYIKVQGHWWCGEFAPRGKGSQRII